jgi:phosphate transport system substrate-binding protein
MVWATGQQLQGGKYVIEEVLGQGGFGITYKALHIRLNRYVVIKTPNEYLKYDPDYNKFVARFIREGQILAQLSKDPHPHIVGVSDSFEEGEINCLVMDFISGENLFELVDRRGVLPQTEAVKYISQIAEALTVVHQAGLVHRDAHPGNIMVRRNGDAVLIDFGIAKELVPSTQTSKGHPGHKGFAPYEQSNDERKPTVDVYCLAATLYYVVTGQRPSTSFDRKVYNATLIPPKQIIPGISNWVNQAILKGMELEARARPQSMQKWLSLLETPSAHHSPTQTHSKTSHSSVSTSPNKSPLAIGLVMSSAFLAMGLGIYYLRSLPADVGQPPSPLPPVADVADQGKLVFNQNLELTGAGTSFPYLLYQRWFQEFNRKYPKVQINYQSVGSGIGVEEFIKGTLDFGASDSTMTDEEIQKVEDRGAIMLPMTAGSIVLAYNLPGVTGELKLPRQVYVDIFLGKITKWNDLAIAKANYSLTLPAQNITVVHYVDGNATTAAFTKHLSAISPEWKSRVGAGKSVPWLVGVGAKGNEGVTDQIQQTPGAISYVDYGYAKNKNLKFAALENKEGKFVVPSDQSATKTLETVQLPENLRAFISDPDGVKSYPLVNYTWMLAYKKYDNADKAKAIEALIEYGLTEGQEYSAELGYVSLPQNVREKVAFTADRISSDYKIEVR